MDPPTPTTRSSEELERHNREYYARNIGERLREIRHLLVHDVTEQVEEIEADLHEHATAAGRPHGALSLAEEVHLGLVRQDMIRILGEIESAEHYARELHTWHAAQVAQEAAHA